MNVNYLKVVCESLSFDKEILIDKNCKDLDEVHKVVQSHPELMTQNITWLMYPMSITM